MNIHILQPLAGNRFDVSDMNDYKRFLTGEVETFCRRPADMEIDPGFAHVTTSKRIAIVGPARTLIGKRQGTVIDSFDIIVRFNDIFELFPFSQELSVDVGTKTDILYCNQVVLRKHVLEQKETVRKSFLQNCSHAGVKFIVCTNNSLDFLESGEPNRACERKDRHVMKEFREFLDRNRSQVRFRLVHEASQVLSQWLRGNWGRTGMVGIVDLLGFGPEVLFLTGMTFYHGGGHILADASTKLHPLKNRDGSWARDASGFGHDSSLELEVLKLLKHFSNGRILADPDLKALLNNGSSTAAS